jgi:hypothetical protein
MGGGAEDHEKAGHRNGEAVQAYLPFGRWSFAMEPRRLLIPWLKWACLLPMWWQGQ